MKFYKIPLMIILCLYFNSIEAQYSNDAFLKYPQAYLGQKTPGDVPEEFAFDFLKVEKHRIQNSSFSPDGKEFIYNVFDEQTNLYTLFHTRFLSKAWTKPEKVDFLGSLTDKTANEPRHHPNGKVLYFVGEGVLYYSVKEGTEWAEAKLWEEPFNSSNTESPTFDQANTIYFWSRREGQDDIYKADVKDGKYKMEINLGLPVNSYAFDADPFVALDGSYLIFTSNRGLKTANYEGSWQGDGGTNLYITYWKSNRWTNPKNLGNEINKDEVWNYSPFVTPDGKYLMFNRRKMGTEGYSKIYWVSTSFVETLKKTNFEPYVNKNIEHQEVKIGNLFSFVIPEETFIDDDGNKSLTYSAKLSNGTPLPSWLKFDKKKKMFSGIAQQPGTISIILTAIDPSKASISAPEFKINITE